MSAQTQSEDWTIRGYQPGDEHELASLFRQVFGREISEEHWLWKLKGQPAPVENVWLAVHDGKPIFQNAALPLRFQLPGGAAVVMVSVDTMTAPEFRRRGLLTLVGRKSYEAWRDAGIPFVLGYPNEQWGSRTQALGWKVLFPLQWLIRPLRPELLLARRLKLPLVGRLPWPGMVWNGFWDRNLKPDRQIQVRQVTEAGTEFDTLWQICRQDFPVSTIRDREWVKWRYLRSPAQKYIVLLAERAGQPAGYIVYRLEESGGRKNGFIPELLVPRTDSAACRTLIGQATSRLQTAGAVVAITLAIPGTWSHRAFRRGGFLFTWGAFTIQFVPLAEDLPLEILHDPNSWGMAGGDFDFI